MNSLNKEQLKKLFEIDFGELQSMIESDMPSDSSESLDDILQHTTKKICVEWSYCNKRQQLLETDEVELAVMLCDLLSGLFGQIPVATISVYLVKYGLNKLCACD
jgi:hypothetical protein